MRLSFHLAEEHSITLRDSEQLSDVISKEGVEHTMFTEWMLMNSMSSEARTLTYSEFPKKFVWDEKKKSGKKGKLEEQSEEFIMHIQLAGRDITSEFY